MSSWSAENATKAFLNTLKMGHKDKEPHESEFISALAAGNNAQLMVMACANVADQNTLALVAAKHQTGGRVICILPNLEQLHLSQSILGLEDSHQIEFYIGDPQNLLLTHFKEADFMLIDCKLENYEGILRGLQCEKKKKSTVVVGFNAFCRGSLLSGGFRSKLSKSQLLPIGGGLLVTKMGVNGGIVGSRNSKRSSCWVVKVDKCTGEEHVFRVRLPQGNCCEA